MKRFHRRCRRLCVLAALLVLLVLFLRQNVLLDTASRHAILLDAQSGRVLAQKRADERAAPASLTKMMTILLAIEGEPNLDKQVTLPEGIFPALQIEKASMAGFAPGETVTVRDLLYGAMLPSGAECCEMLARLAADSPLPIALDEELIGCNTPEGKRKLLSAINPQYIVLKPSLHGGICGGNEWIAEAEKRHIGWWITSALESNIGLNAIAQWCATFDNPLPQGLGTGLLFTDNVEMPLEVRKDCLWFCNDDI